MQAALAASFSVWTCDPVDQSRWSPDNPAWGHCGGAALVVSDHLGGELLLAKVCNGDGARAGWHYSNRLPDGETLDLTRDQFRDGQRLGAPEPVVRPADLSRARIIGHCALLSLRVDRALAARDPTPQRPVSIKAVCTDHEGRVLLARNDRGQWELPGGRPEIGEAFEDTVIRELQEETGRRGTVDRLIGARELEVSPGAWVDLVAYRCEIDDGPLVAGDEHLELAYLDPLTLREAELPAAYRDLAAAAAALSAGRWCA